MVIYCIVSKDSGLNNLRNLTQIFCFRLDALRRRIVIPTQRSESIQAGTKRHVKFRRLFDPESLLILFLSKTKREASSLQE